jgi:hypothetical protein
LARTNRLTAVTAVRRAAVNAGMIETRFGSGAARVVTGSLGAAVRLRSSGVARAVAGAQPVTSRRPEPADHPRPFETAIELPYRLLLSPHAGEGFAHSAAPIEREEPVELWHSRLTARTSSGAADESASELRTVRAVWIRD